MAKVDENLEDYFSIRGLKLEIQESVMPLIAKKGDGFVQVGTGFVINENGLMMTASHVIEEAERHKTLEINENGEYYDHYEMYAVYVSRDSPEKNPQSRMGGFINITHGWADEDHDIGVCFLQPTFFEGKRKYFRPLLLSPGVPEKGIDIWGYGYPDNKIEVDEEGDFNKYFHKNAFSKATIVEVYPEGRDKGLLYFPCFYTNGRFDGGMSGGPIFNEAGYVCGVICSSLPPDEEYNKYDSHGSIIGAALDLEMKLSFDSSSESETFTLYDLIKRRLVLTDDSIDSLVDEE